MVTGPPAADDAEFEGYQREQLYHLNLDCFEGVPGTAHGITDDLDNLSDFIKVIGDSVLEQEKEFNTIYSEEQSADVVFLTDRTLVNWYKKHYRSFSYKAILTVIHGVFETGLTDLHTMLTENKRITFDFKNQQLMDKLKDFKKLEPTLQPLIDKARPFNFIRNKILHSDGYFKRDSRYQAFENFVKGRSDIVVSTLPAPNTKYTHRISIRQSGVLHDYLRLIQEIFTVLVKAAHNARYIEVKPDNWQLFILFLKRFMRRFLFIK